MKLEELTNRFDQHLLSQVRKNEKVTRITIQPASMGRMTVVCREENSALVVEVLTQSNNVRDLVAQQEAAVRTIMEKHNMELSQFDVSLGQRESGNGNERQDPSKGHKTADGTGPATEEVSSEPDALNKVNKSGSVSLMA
jgi:flagellar hook-length control protein FliK